MRVAEGAARPSRNGGYVHVLRAGARPHLIERSIVLDDGRPTNPNLDGLQAYYRRLLQEDPALLTEVARDLALPAAVLVRLQIGWSEKRGASTWPMRDATRRIVGIRYRYLEGGRRSAKGGREGLFFPTELPTSIGRLLLPEGCTDTAAALALGFHAVGRPSCSGGVKYVTDLVRRLNAPEVVVIADRDASGRRGAASLAVVLRAYVPRVRIVEPPRGANDLRDAVRRGWSACDMAHAIDAADVLSLRVGRCR